MAIWVKTVGRMQKKEESLKIEDWGQIWKYLKWNSLTYLSKLITASVENNRPVKTPLAAMNIQIHARGILFARSSPIDGNPNLTIRRITEEMLISWYSMDRRTYTLLMTLFWTGGRLL